jgi:hypothetical protein
MQYNNAKAGELEKRGFIGIAWGCFGIRVITFLANLSNRLIGGR